MAIDVQRQWVNQFRRGASVLTKMNGMPRRVSREANEDLVKGRVLPKLIRRRFDTQGGSQGRFWKGLAAATKRERVRQGFGAGPRLVRTGTLRKHAVQGRVTATSTSIRITMRAGRGPRYRGRKKSAALSRYAPSLNAERPFYGPFKGKERRAIMDRRSRFIGRRYADVLNARA